MPLHSALTGSELHEPKGADTATVDEVYVSTGGGSGAWQKIESDQIDTTSIKNANIVYLQGVFVDISLAETVYVPLDLSDFDGWYLKSCSVVLQGAITVANSIVTAEVITTAGVAWQTAGTITIVQAASAAGSTFVGTFSATNQLSGTAFGEGPSIRISTDGGSTTAIKASFTVKLAKSNT